MSSPQSDATVLNEPFGLELPELILALRKRWWLVVLTTLIGAAAAYVTASRQPKVYTASAKLIVDPVLPKVLGEEDFDVNGSSSLAEDAFYNTQYEIIRSRAVLRGVISQLRLTEDESYLQANEIAGVPPGEERLKVVEALMRSALEVVLENNSRVVTLNVADHDPNRAARIANTIGQVYIDQSLEGRLSETHGASKWLDERLDDFGKRLDDSEKALHEFKRANMLISVSLEDRKNMTASRLTSLSDKLNEIRAKLIELEAERETFQRLAGTGDLQAMLAIPRVAKNQVVQTLMAAQVELEREQAMLSSRYLAKHPNMEAVQKQMATVAQRLNEELTRSSAILENELSELKGAETRLNTEINLEVAKAIEVNNLGMEYNKLNRDVGSNQKTYGALLKRQTEADLSGLLRSNFVRWMETAEPNARPVRPVIGLNTIVGAVLGLLAGLALIMIGVLVDNTVHTQDEIENRLRLPFLGLLPSIEEMEKAARASAAAKPGNVPVPRTRDLYIVHNPKSSVAECARSLRTNLLFLGARKPLRRLLVTSAGPSEGKSTTVIALGTTMALAGNRVLLVDTDFRRPRLHRTFGVSNEQGLTNVLLGSGSAADLVKSTDVVGLDILPCGPLPPNPSELLHSEPFLKALDELSSRYDRVILDSPPVNAVTDANILSQLVDGTILVIKASKTTKDAARRAARHLMGVNGNILGVVLNDVDLAEDGYYRYHQYYYYSRSYETDEKAST